MKDYFNLTGTYSVLCVLNTFLFLFFVAAVPGWQTSGLVEKVALLGHLICLIRLFLVVGCCRIVAYTSEPHSLGDLKARIGNAVLSGTELQLIKVFTKVENWLEHKVMAVLNCKNKVNILSNDTLIADFCKFVAFNDLRLLKLKSCAKTLRTPGINLVTSPLLKMLWFSIFFTFKGHTS